MGIRQPSDLTRHGGHACSFYVCVMNNPGLPTSSDHTQVSIQMLIRGNHTIGRGLLIRGHEEFGETSPRLFDRLVRVVADFWLLWRLSRSGTNNIDLYHRMLMRGGDIDGRSIGPYCRRPEAGRCRTPHPDAVAEDLRWILRKKGGIASREDWIIKASELAHGATCGRPLLQYAFLGAYHDSVVANPPKEFIRKGASGSLHTLTPARFDSGLTVEHIAPKIQRVDDTSFGDQIYREGRVQRLGNLTLLPKRENRILSSKSWREKQKYFRVYSERDPEERRRWIENFSLDPETANLLAQRFVPFCGDLAQLRTREWNETHVAVRGKNLAGLIWERFAPSLRL